MREVRGMAAMAAVVAFGLTGCAGTLTGLEGESKFACKAPDGVTCSSLSGIYANAVANNLPALRKERKGEHVATSQSKDSVITGQAASSGDPLRIQPTVLRIWIAPWEDTDGDLHDQSYLYVVANAGRWAIEHNQRQIVDRYRPTFLKPGSTSKSTQKPVPQTPRQALPLGGPTLPGNQAISPPGSDAFAGDRE
jgi:conjugal transfer pilus assembly protein TraV